MKKLIFTLVLFALLLSACNGAPTPAVVLAAADNTPPAITAEGRLLPTPSAELAFVQAGVVSEVLVRPGEAVQAGQVLARLVGIETAQAELAAAQLEQTLARQALDGLKRGAMLSNTEAHKALQAAQKVYETEARGWRLQDKEKATELELALDRYLTAETSLRAAKTELDGLAGKDRESARRARAQQTYDEEKQALSARYAELVDDLPAVDERLSDKQTALLKAISTLELARQQVERLEKGIDHEQAAAAEARLKSAEAHRSAAQAALAFFELRAPFAGRVLSLKGLAVGEAALPGQPVAFLAGSSAWVVETKDLAEIDIARVAEGLPAKIQLDAFPAETFSGTVSAIDPVGQVYLSDMTYQVTITLSENDPRFLWNMTATVRIETE